MSDRSLRIAFGISLGIHIFAMSAVMIVIPEKAGRKRSLTRVDFLGSILEKTAFDIMLQGTNPAVETSYSLGDTPFGYRDLQVSPPGRMSFKLEFPQHLENSMDSIILSTLTGYKIVPNFSLPFAPFLFSYCQGFPHRLQHSGTPFEAFCSFLPQRSKPKEPSVGERVAPNATMVIIDPPCNFPGTSSLSIIFE